MIFSEPWPHIVDDNYFDSNSFEMVKTEIIDFVKTQKIKTGITIFDNLNVQDYPTLIKTIKGVNDRIFDNVWIDQNFPFHRLYSKKLKAKHQIIVCIGESEYRIHEDSPDKILSIVTYVHPNKSAGTLIYDKNKQFVKQVDWKPARTLIFAPMDKTTWHNYKSIDKSFRITLNTFLMRDNE
jgi:hypothetical protein